MIPTVVAAGAAGMTAQTEIVGSNVTVAQATAFRLEWASIFPLQMMLLLSMDCITQVDLRPLVFEL